MSIKNKIQIKLKNFLSDLQAFSKPLVTRIQGLPIKYMRFALSNYKHTRCSNCETLS